MSKTTWLLLVLSVIMLIIVGSTDADKHEQYNQKITALQDENDGLKSTIVNDPTTYIATDSTEYKYLDGYEIRNDRAILHVKGGQVLNYPENHCKFVPGHIPPKVLPEYGCFVYVDE